MPKKSLALIWLCTLLACLPRAEGGEFFVVNGFGSVVTHHTDHSGNAPALRTISGPNTGLQQTYGAVVDRTWGELFVSDLAQNKIEVFRHDADGDVSPIRTIQGPSTQIANPLGLAYDPNHDELYVALLLAHKILVFAAGVDGDTAPVRVIEGPATEIEPATVAIAFDPQHNELVVASRNPANTNSAILVFPRTAEGNVPPIRTIGSPELSNDLPYGIFVDSENGEYLATLEGTGGVITYPRTANGTDVAPIRHLAGPQTEVSDPGGLYLDHREDTLVVSGQTSHELWVFDRTADGDTPPLRTITGHHTGVWSPRLLTGPRQIIFRGDFETGDLTQWSIWVQ